MVATKNKKIDGVDVSVTQFGGVQAFKVKAKLVKTVGPALATAFGAIQGGMESDIKVDMLGTGLKSLAENLDSDEGFSLIMSMLDLVAVGGVKVDSTAAFDQVFAGGRMVLLYKILYFVVEVNYPDFFGMVGAGVGNLKSIVQKNSASTK